MAANRRNTSVCRWRFWAGVAGLSLAALGTHGAETADHGIKPHGHAATQAATQAGLAVPASVREEHEEIHAALAAVIQRGGKTGAAAKNLHKVLQPHFEKEEQVAMPPLGALRDAAAGNIEPARARKAVELAGQLKTELPTMLREHGDIGKALDKLAEVARSEGRADGTAFAERLRQHARQEEEVLYPAAVVVGEYLKLRK